MESHVNLFHQGRMPIFKIADTSVESWNRPWEVTTLILATWQKVYIFSVETNYQWKNTNDEWKTVLKKWKRKYRNTRLNCLFYKRFSYLKRNKQLLCHLRESSIFPCKQNVILTIFSQQWPNKIYKKCKPFHDQGYTKKVLLLDITCLHATGMEIKHFSTK